MDIKPDRISDSGVQCEKHKRSSDLQHIEWLHQFVSSHWSNCCWLFLWYFLCCCSFCLYLFAGNTLYCVATCKMHVCCVCVVFLLDYLSCDYLELYLIFQYNWLIDIFLPTVNSLCSLCVCKPMVTLTDDFIIW